MTNASDNVAAARELAGHIRSRIGPLHAWADIYDALDGLVALAALAAPQPTAAAPDVLAMREALQEILNLCAIGDVNEDTEAYGWGDAIKRANAALSAQGEAKPEPRAAEAGPNAWGERIAFIRSGGHYLSAWEAWQARGALSIATPEPQEGRKTAAVRDVLAERRRQVEVEGWTPKHDDMHGSGAMALAAACYACNAATWAQREPSIPAADYAKFATPGFRWPWAMKWWKPKSQRQDLVKAGALILAEIERLDRVHGITQDGERDHG